MCNDVQMEQVVVFAIKLIEVLGAVVILLGAVAFVIGFFLSVLKQLLIEWLSKKEAQSGRRIEDPRRRSDD